MEGRTDKNLFDGFIAKLATNGIVVENYDGRNGIVRRRYSSKIGTVKAVSPWAGL